MSTPASIAKHPIHPMLVVFPIGLWVFSLVSDVVFLLGGSERWNDIAFYTMAGGLIGALAAAVPGLFDMLSISDPKVGKIAWNHMILNAIAVVIFAADLSARILSRPGAILPVFLSVAGVVFLAVAGWLGGEMVYVHGAGVEQRPRDGVVDRHGKRQGNLRRLG
jgi:uncharacterized membrane protein